MIKKFLNELFGNDKASAFLAGSCCVYITKSVTLSEYNSEFQFGFMLALSFMFLMIYRRSEKKRKAKEEIKK